MCWIWSTWRRKRAVSWELLKAIQIKYGSLEFPDFAFVKEALSKQPYQEIRHKLEELFALTEDTDPNDDVSFGYILRKNGTEWVLRLSMIGPYGVLLKISSGGRIMVCDPSALTADEKEIERLLCESKITLLDEKTLMTAIRIKLQNSHEENTRIYQALFSDTNILPWEFIPPKR